ncbi:MAG: hypothetical protein AB7H86_10810 [Blastocatellales bacterium]
MKLEYSKILRFPAMLAILTLLAAPAASRGLFQTDDDLVRKGYLNLMLYHSAGKKAEAAGERREHVPYDDIDIYIFNTYTGNLSEFADRKLFELVTPPTDEMIQLSRLVRSTDKDPTRYLVYEARWIPGRYVPPSPITLRQWLQTAGYNDVEKMTTYEVRVRLEGREKTYRALALHHKPPQMKKDGKIEYVDMILGNNGALTELTVEDRPAFGSRERSPSRKDSPTKPGLESDPRKGNRQPDRPSFDLSRLDNEPDTGLIYDRTTCDMSGLCCPVGYTSLSQCCSSPMGQWSGFLPTCSSGGIGDWDGVFGRGDYGGGGFDDGGDPPPPGDTCRQERVYANPSQHVDSNTAGHIFGSHGGNTTLKAYCNVETNCQASCGVQFPDTQQYEHGMVTLDIIPPLGALFWHSVGPAEKYVRSASGFINGNNTPPTCSAGVAFTVKLCFLGLYCSHSINFGDSGTGVTVSTNDNPYLLYKHVTTHTCQRQL